jgi:GNAT superfamily N-acetyltransferase
MNQSPRATTVSFAESSGIRKIAIGRDAELEQQLYEKSTQEHILRHTPKDAAKRFGSEAQFVQWLAKGRTLHWLLGDDRDLAGVIWYGKEPMPDVKLPSHLREAPEETFAIRLYEGYAGRGFAREAMTNSLTLAASQQVQASGEINGIWLQTNVDNPAAITTYNRFGYEEIYRDEQRATMILPAATIAQIAGIAGVGQPQIS